VELTGDDVDGLIGRTAHKQLRSYFQLVLKLLRETVVDAHKEGSQSNSGHRLSGARRTLDQREGVNEGVSYGCSLDFVRSTETSNFVVRPVNRH